MTTKTTVSRTCWVLLGAALAFAAYHRGPFAPAGPEAKAQSGADVQFPTPPATAREDLTPEELANVRVHESASRSVVNIDTQTEQIDPFFMRRIPGQGSGSGSVLDDEGHILTNAHVIENAKQIEVTMVSGDSYLASLVGQDRTHDIAVLKVDAPAEQLHPLPLGQSDGLLVGQQVYALGNPFGLEGTLTKGIISSLNRSIEGRTGREMKTLIQTDAAMNPGNSGGPLLDSGGRMIGMNVAIASRTGQNTGVGFAIPASRIRTIVPQLIEHGRVIRPDHGIVAAKSVDQGLLIFEVRDGSPADRAGLRGVRVVKEVRREGPFVYEVFRRDYGYADVLQAVDGQQVRTHSDFLNLMDRYKPGQTVTFTILRDGAEREVELTLGEA